MSIATIKYYIREGLLPAAPLKTGRTMGYYDQAYLDRLRLIRTLREVHFLPLRVIKAILAERSGVPLGPEEAEILARLAPNVVKALAGGGETTRDEIKRRYELSDEVLGTLEEMDLVGEVTPTGRVYRSTDLELLDALHAFELEGIGRSLFPVEGLGNYVELLGELARREVSAFIHKGLPSMNEAELDRITQRGLELSETLILVIHRRLLARAWKSEIREGTDPAK